MKVSNFDPEFGQLLGASGGGTGGSAAVIALQIVQQFLTELQAGDVVFNFESIVNNLTEAGAAHCHAVNEVQIGDGSSTTFYLANWPDEGSVVAYVGGHREDPTVSGDAVIFPSAPATFTKIQFDYVMELV